MYSGAKPTASAIEMCAPRGHVTIFHVAAVNDVPLSASEVDVMHNVHGVDAVYSGTQVTAVPK